MERMFFGDAVMKYPKQWIVLVNVAWEGPKKSRVCGDLYMVTPDRNEALAVMKELDKAGTFGQVDVTEGFDDTPQIGGFRITDLFLNPPDRTENNIDNEKPLINKAEFIHISEKEQTHVTDVVINILSEIEKTENVKIIYAAESGSRAWGFESPDSDYDVRFIYTRPKDFYLRLDKTRDVIEIPPDDILDINGWDIKKALILLHGSNPTLFEWANSRILYKTTPQWNEVRKILNEYFKPKKALCHYLNMAIHNWQAYFKDDSVKLKKYLYVIRPLLACEWILKTGAAPPMLFSELSASVLEPEIKPPSIIFSRLKLPRRKQEKPRVSRNLTRL